MARYVQSGQYSVIIHTFHSELNKALCTFECAAQYKSDCSHMRKLEKRSTCPISYSLDILGDKWVILILRDIALAQKHFYKDFLDAGEHIATNVLSDRLKMLEQQGIIKSEPYEKNKTMKFYFLTEKGIDLIPMIIELWVWGARHDSESAVGQKELQERLLNRDQNIDRYIEEARKYLD